MKSQLTLLVIAFAILLGSCAENKTDTAVGYVRLEMGREGRAVTLNGLTALYVTVSGDRMATSGRLVETSVTNPVIEITAGENRVLKIWARQSEGGSDFLSSKTVSLIYGESDPFEIVTGRTTTVNIELASSSEVSYTEYPLLGQFFYDSARVTGDVYLRRVSDGFLFKWGGSFTNGIYYGGYPENFPWEVDIVVDGKTILSAHDFSQSEGSDYSVNSYSVVGRGVSVRVASFGQTLADGFDSADADSDNLTNARALLRGKDPFNGGDISGLSAHDCQSGFTLSSGYCVGGITNVTSSSSNGYYTVGSTVSIQVTFGSAVTVTGTPTLTLETGATDRTASYSSGSGTTSLTFTYTVQAGDTASDLDYANASALSGTIVDGAENAVSLTLPTPGAEGSLGSNKALVVDTTAPTVTNITSSTANGSFAVGEAVSIQVTFSEAVTVTGTPTLTLETGSTDRTVNYSSGTGTTSLTFSYTVQSGDSNADLDYAATGSLSAGGGTIRDAATNNATLTLPSPGAAGSLAANKALLVDGVAPTAGSLVTYASVTGTTLTANWGAASDDLTAVGNLQYKLVYSTTSTDIDTAAEADAASGGSVLLDYTAATLTYNVTGLAAGTNYHFRVVVKDALGNLALTAASNRPTGKMIFTTTAGHSGAANFGNIAGLDAHCESYARTNADTAATLKAVVTDGSTRIACTTANCGGGVGENTDWVLAPSTTYYGSTGSEVGTTTAAGIFSFNLTNAVTTGGEWWSGFNTNWTSNATDCTNWTSTASTGRVGNAGSSTTTMLYVYLQNCNRTDVRVMCAEQ